MTILDTIMTDLSGQEGLTPACGPQGESPAAPSLVSHWYVLSTRVGHERKTARTITTVMTRRRGEPVECLVVCDLGRDGKEQVRWPGLVLVATDGSADAIDALVKIPGVLGTLSAQPLSETEYEAMTRMLTTDTQTDIHELAPGEVVEVCDGAFATMTMTVTEVDGDRITGLVTVFGRETPVTLDRHQILRTISAR